MKLFAGSDFQKNIVIEHNKINFWIAIDQMGKMFGTFPCGKALANISYMYAALMMVCRGGKVLVGLMESCHLVGGNLDGGFGQIKNPNFLGYFEPKYFRILFSQIF